MSEAATGTRRAWPHDALATLLASDDVIERLADLVVSALVEHEDAARSLRTSEAATAKLLTVRQVAELLGVPRDFVYRHKQALGAIRLPSTGSRGRLRFDRDTLRERLREHAEHVAAPAGGARRRSRNAAPTAELLPVRPRQVA